MACKQLFPLSFGAILGEEGIQKLLPALLLPPRIGPKERERDHLHAIMRLSAKLGVLHPPLAMPLGLLHNF